MTVPATLPGAGVWPDWVVEFGVVGVVGVGACAGMVPVPAGLPGAGADSACRTGTSATHKTRKKTKLPAMNLGFINPFLPGIPAIHAQRSAFYRQLPG